MKILSPLLWRLLTALSAALLLSYWIWVVFAPSATPLLSSNDTGVNVDGGQIFGVAAIQVPTIQSASAAPQQAELLNNVTIVGVFASSNPKKAFAILQLDPNTQKSIVIGEVVNGDVTLASVGKDYIELARGETKQRIHFELNKLPNTVQQ